MKNDVFNFKRFGRYFVTDLRAAISNYGISLLVLATMILSIDLFVGAFTYVTTATGYWQGIGIGVRGTLTVIFAVVALISAPAKLYGHLTDKKDGTAFLMLPASTLEKYVSMVLICAVVVPVIYLGLTSIVDALTCLVDPTCGSSLISTYGEFKEKFILEMQEAQAEVPINMNGILKMANPILYADDIIQWILFFLLGAIFFKKSKIAKTIGSVILLSMAVSLIFTPIFVLSTFGQILTDDPAMLTPEYVFENGTILGWTMNHLALVDTIQDTICNVALLFLIWLRLKKMKH